MNREEDILAGRNEAELSRIWLFGSYCLADKQKHLLRTMSVHYGAPS